MVCGVVRMMLLTVCLQCNLQKAINGWYVMQFGGGGAWFVRYVVWIVYFSVGRSLGALNCWGGDSRVFGLLLGCRYRSWFVCSVALRVQLSVRL